MKAPIPEYEELIVVDYIYTTYLIQNLESDHQIAGKLKFKIPEVYEVFIDQKLKDLRKNLVRLKEQMKDLKIKVAEPYKVDIDFVEYPYFAHGFEGKMRFWTFAMKYEGNRRLMELFKARQ